MYSKYSQLYDGHIFIHLSYTISSLKIIYKFNFIDFRRSTAVALKYVFPHFPLVATEGHTEATWTWAGNADEATGGSFFIACVFLLEANGRSQSSSKFFISPPSSSAFENVGCVLMGWNLLHWTQRAASSGVTSLWMWRHSWFFINHTLLARLWLLDNLCSCVRRINPFCQNRSVRVHNIIQTPSVDISGLYCI